MPTDRQTDGHTERPRRFIHDETALALSPYERRIRFYGDRVARNARIEIFQDRLPARSYANAIRARCATRN